MDFLGGLFITLILLGLLFAAIWLSLPFFLMNLYRKEKESRAALVQLEDRLLILEEQMKHQITPDK